MSPFPCGARGLQASRPLPCPYTPASIVILYHGLSAIPNHGSPRRYEVLTDKEVGRMARFGLAAAIYHSLCLCATMVIILWQGLTPLVPI